MSDILSPDGHLICVEFPTYKDPLLPGPPWALPPDVYVGHLGKPGENVPYDERGRIQLDPSGRIGKGGLERIAHWQAERTHDIGKGTDWVSIWRHPRPATG
jgi:methyl halide transferase